MRFKIVCTTKDAKFKWETLWFPTLKRAEEYVLSMEAWAVPEDAVFHSESKED